jgi:taurine dioxygenase
VKITPTADRPLHARIEGVDLSRPLSAEAFAEIEAALARHGVLSFPRQRLAPIEQKQFAERFGQLEINVANRFHEPGHPEMMILSNVRVGDAPIGLQDAGQGWHTDLSYGRTVGYTTMLHALEIPHRDGRPLGATEFASTTAAYDELPADLKTHLRGKTVLHDFDKFWEMMRTVKGSPRPPLTEAQRAARPPTSHPIFLKHPVSGRTILYANPGYAVRINELPTAESDRILAQLFEHQVQPPLVHRHEWAVGDVLIWDNLSTIHNAVSDYRPDERRLLKRCQTLTTRFGWLQAIEG